MDDESKLYQCASKYEKIVQQFDGLIEIMNTRARPPKRRRNHRGSKNGTKTPASSNQLDEINEGYVQTITTFIHELQAKCTPAPADVDCSTITKS